MNCPKCGKEYIKKPSYNIITKQWVDRYYPLCTCEYNAKQNNEKEIVQ